MSRNKITWMLLALTLVLSLVLSACGTSATEAPTAEEPAVEETAVEEPAAAIRGEIPVTPREKARKVGSGTPRARECSLGRRRTDPQFRDCGQDRLLPESPAAVCDVHSFTLLRQQE